MQNNIKNLKVGDITDIYFKVRVSNSFWFRDEKYIILEALGSNKNKSMLWVISQTGGRLSKEILNKAIDIYIKT